MNPDFAEAPTINTSVDNVDMSVQVIKENLTEMVNENIEEERLLTQEEKDLMIAQLEVIEKELQDMEVDEDVETLQSELEATIIDTYVDSIFNIGDIQKLIAQKPGSLFQKETLEELEKLHSKMSRHIETNVRKFRKQAARSAVPKQQKEEMLFRFNSEIKPLKEDVINLYKLITEIKSTKKVIIEKLKEQNKAKKDTAI